LLLRPDDLDEADLDAELDMLGDELEEEMTVGLQEESATPSYLLPSIPNAEPGKKVPMNTACPKLPLAIARVLFMCFSSRPNGCSS
jgi:hypothetical protein